MAEVYRGFLDAKPGATVSGEQFDLTGYDDSLMKIARRRLH
jgi:hypothetical protein